MSNHYHHDSWAGLTKMVSECIALSKAAPSTPTVDQIELGQLDSLLFGIAEVLPYAKDADDNTSAPWVAEVDRLIDLVKSFRDRLSKLHEQKGLATSGYSMSRDRLQELVKAAEVGLKCAELLNHAYRHPAMSSTETERRKMIDDEKFIYNALHEFEAAPSKVEGDKIRAVLEKALRQAPGCTCSEAYKSRGMSAPDCAGCESHELAEGVREALALLTK